MGSAISTHAPSDVSGRNRHISERTANLDRYGGKNRPPVKRGQSFEKAMEWLGQSVSQQADDLRSALVANDAKGKGQPDRRSQRKGDVQRRLLPWREKGPGNEAVSAARERHVGEQPASSSARTPRYMASTAASNTAKSSTRAVKPGMTRQQAGGKWLSGTGSPTKPKARRSIFGLARREEQAAARDWRGNVMNAKKKAYLAMRVYLKLHGMRGYTVPEAIAVDIPRCITGALSPNFEKFASNQMRYHCSTSSFSLSQFHRSSTIRVVDLDEDDGEYRDIGLDVVRDESESGSEAGPSARERSSEDQARIMMEMFARKANARWVEGCNWDLPATFELSNHSISGERTHYNHKAKQMLRKGRIAFHFLAAAETATTQDGRAISCITNDTWQLMKQMCSSQVPSGLQVEGLPPLARQLLQLVETIFRLVGQEGVDNLNIAIHVNEDEEEVLINLLKGHSFYGLGPHQFCIFVQGKKPGCRYVKRHNKLQETDEAEPRMPGTGHAMLQLATRGEASTWREGMELERMEVSLLEHYRQRGVLWLMSVRMLDLHWCADGGPVDLDFYGLSLRLHEQNSANMTVEVLPAADVLEMRYNNSVVLSQLGQHGRGVSACDIAFTDCLTMKIQDELHERAKDPGASLYTSAHRYFIYLPELQAQLVERTTFRADVIISSGFAYLEFDMADITSGPLARCAAVVQRQNTRKAPPPTPQVESRWLQGVASALSKQDQNDFFVQRAVQCQTPTAPITINRKPYIGEQSLRMVLFVCDNPSSRKAVRLAKVLMQNEANSLRIATTTASQHGIERAEALLSYFRGLLGIVPSNQLTTEVVMRRSGTTVETLIDYIGREKTDIVIMGSEQLSDQHPMGSVTMSVLRSISCSLLVVKRDASGDCTKEDVDRKLRSDRRSIKCMVPVDHNSRSALKFAMQALSPLTDRFVLFRQSAASRATVNQVEDGASDKRMLDHFQELATLQHFKAQTLIADGHWASALPRSAAETNCDLISFRARGRVGPEVEQMICNSRTAVLLCRSEDEALATPRPSESQLVALKTYSSGQLSQLVAS
uniref:UspA domain-containing protein n=1 Tax=Tetraselmis sp. GSL018 TaxID=582737 RepID=A0A061QRP6_9CHLO